MSTPKVGNRAKARRSTRHAGKRKLARERRAMKKAHQAVARQKRAARRALLGPKPPTAAAIARQERRNARRAARKAGVSVV